MMMGIEDKDVDVRERGKCVAPCTVRNDGCCADDDGDDASSFPVMIFACITENDHLLIMVNAHHLLLLLLQGKRQHARGDLAKTGSIHSARIVKEKRGGRRRGRKNRNDFCRRSTVFNALFGGKNPRTFSFTG